MLESARPMLEFFNIDVDAEIESIKSHAGWTLPVLDFACCRSENGLEKARSPSATVVRPGLGLTFRSYCRRQPHDNRVIPQLAT